MKKIKIFDTTLRDGEQAPGYSMSKEDKIRIAKKLDEMGVDVIEAGFAASNANDFYAIQEMSKVVKNATICSLARCNTRDIDIAYEAIKDAPHKRIHTFIGTSPTHMEYKLKKTEDEIIDIVDRMVKYARSKVDDVEFSLEDATRTDRDFACRVIDTAIASGATTINIPDTVGYTSPEEFKEYITYLREHSRLDEVDISVHCHNDLGLATANSLSAINAGANQIECTINGIGERAGNTALEEVVANIDTRSKYYDAYTDIDLSMIYDLSQTVQKVTGQPVQKNKAIVGDNAFKHEAGIHQQGVINNKETYEIMDPKKYGIDTDNIVIGIHSGKNAIVAKMESMGYTITAFDVQSILYAVKSYYYQKLEAGDRSNITDEDFVGICQANKHKVKTLNKNATPTNPSAPDPHGDR